MCISNFLNHLSITAILLYNNVNIGLGIMTSSEHTSNLDWATILEPYRKHLTVTNPVKKSEEMISQLITLIERGQVKYKICGDLDAPIGYCLAYSHPLYSDRLQCNLSFLEPTFSNSTDLEDMLKWFKDLKLESEKSIFVYDVLNVQKKLYPLIEAEGFHVMERVDYFLDLDKLKPFPPPSDVEHKFLSVRDIDLKEYAETVYSAYEGRVDSYIMADQLEERIKHYKAYLIDKAMGEIINYDSLVLSIGGHIAGACLTTYRKNSINKPVMCDLRDIWIVPEIRGKGFAEYLIYRSLSKARELGIKSVRGTITKGNTSKYAAFNLGSKQQQYPPQVDLILK